MAISAMTQMNNNRGGNGQFRPMARRPKQLETALTAIDKKDIRMRFRNSRDPIYIAFDYLHKRPVQELAVDFVKDSIYEIMNFIFFKK
mgnify:FL=1